MKCAFKNWRILYSSSLPNMLEDNDYRYLREMISREVRAALKDELATVVDETTLKYALNALEERIVRRLQA